MAFNGVFGEKEISLFDHIGKRQDGTKFVSVYVGDKWFNFPINFIWTKEALLGGAIEGVNLWALLPDMEPYTGKTKLEYEKPGAQNVIIIILAQHNIEGSAARKKSMSGKDVYARRLRGFSVVGRQSVQAGLEKLELTGESFQSIKDSEFYISSEGGEASYWVECNSGEAGFCTA